ncbi:MAG: hypothetical protein ABIM45_02815 [candidate division WOR-3 bacterium]
MIRPEEYHPSISIYAQFKDKEELEKVLKTYKRIIEKAKEQ